MPTTELSFELLWPPMSFVTYCYAYNWAFLRTAVTTIELRYILLWLQLSFPSYCCDHQWALLRIVMTTTELSLVSLWPPLTFRYISLWPHRASLISLWPPLSFLNWQHFTTTEYTEKQPLLSGVHSVMRVKSALAGEGEPVHAHPLSLHLPSPVKLQCTLQPSGQTH